MNTPSSRLRPLLCIFVGLAMLLSVGCHEGDLVSNSTAGIAGSGGSGGSDGSGGGTGGKTGSSIDCNTVSLFELDAYTIGLWHFDENQGVTTADGSDNGFDGTLHDATWDTGCVSASLRFDGAGDYVQLGAVAHDEFFPIAGVTIEALIFLDSAPQDGSIIFDIQNTLALIVGGQQLPSLAVMINETQTAVGSEVALTIGSWHHVAGTFDGNAMRLWIDGVMTGERIFPGTLTRASTVFNGQCEIPKVGSYCNTNGGWFDGRIDELRVSSVARYAPAD